LTLKRGMSQIWRGSTHGFGNRASVSPDGDQRTIWVADFFSKRFMLSYMTVLSWADYSYVMPAGAFGIRSAHAAGRLFFLHESVRRALV